MNIMNDRMKLKIAYLAIVGAGLALIVAMSSCSNQSMASDKKLHVLPIPLCSCQIAEIRLHSTFRFISRSIISRREAVSS